MKTHKRSLSHFNITAMDSGYAVPIQIQEVLPGDTAQGSTSALVRLQPMTAPTMHPIHITIASFFVPHRLTWENWEDFITNPNSTAVAPELQYAAGNPTTHPYNYMGVQAPAANNAVMNALPMRAYQLIYNEYLRDQDLETEATISFADGLDITTSQALQQVSWQKDHLTAARPWAQKGPQVTIPIQGDPTQSALVQRVTNASAVKFKLAGGNTDSGAFTPVAANASSQMVTGGGGTGLSIDPNGSLAVDGDDIGQMLSMLPNDIRIGIAYQKWEELAARYGTRYTEYLRARFNVLAQDSRLQRPEFLSMGTQTIQMSEVLQTSNPGTPSDPEDATGALKGHGIGKARSMTFRKFFPEHGYVITLAWIRPINIYANGAPRLFFKKAKFDYFTHEFAHIGSAAVYKGETFVRDESVPDQNLETFGFYDQYYDYRKRLSYVSGAMRTTFKYWTECRDFVSQPTLNSSFVKCNPSDRIFAAPVDQNYLVMVHNKFVVRGQVPKVGMSSNF